MARKQLGRSAAEAADAKKTSLAPSQSMSYSTPNDMGIVKVWEQVGTKGEKKSSEKDAT